MKISSLCISFLSVALSITNASAFVPKGTSGSRSMPFMDRKVTSLEMAASGTMTCRPIGVGHAAPDKIITNVDLESVVETSDEWIQTRTGIAQRRVLTGDETLRSLGIKAANQALINAGVSADDIDMVICATSTPDDIFGDATAIAAEIGCSTDTVAFDLTAACSGFLFASATAGQFLSLPGTKMKNILVIGADALSRWVNWDDRNVCILFGDGAGAMVLTNQGDDEAPGLLGFSAHSNGNGYEDLNCLYNGEPRALKTPNEETVVTSGKYSELKMNGQEVYKFATREVPRVIQEALDMADMKVDDVDWLLLHQANIRIMDVVAKRLGIPFEKVIHNLDQYGNTSAASIPIALSEAVASGKVKKGDVIACSGFGAGLSWGAVIMRWGK